MNKLSNLLLLVLLTVACSTPKTYNHEYLPAPNGFVNDFENILTVDEEMGLKQLISDHEKATSNEISIVTISSYEPHETLFDYSYELAKYWGIGKKDINNGVMIIYGDSIREVRIQIGIGLEEKFTDWEAKQIIDSIMIPEFKKNNYFLGTKLGIEAVIEEIK